MRAQRSNLFNCFSIQLELRAQRSNLFDYSSNINLNYDLPSIEIIGLVAAVLTTGGFIPQVYKTWKEKSTKDISLTMYSVLLIGVFLWIVYGVYIGSRPVILSNGSTAILLFAMLLLKLKYK